MVRRALFFGLTLLLISVLAALMIRGCRQEKEPAPKIVETVEQAQLSPTRVFNPQDLAIVLLKTDWQKKEIKGESIYEARHTLEISNRGNLSYKEIQVRFVYKSGSGKPEVRTHSITKTVSPGARVKLSDVPADEFRRVMTDTEATIVYADLVAAGSPG